MTTTTSVRPVGNLLRGWRARRRMSQLDLAFFSTTTVFGTPVEITLSELAIESFFLADAHTAAVLGRMALRQT